MALALGLALAACTGPATDQSPTPPPPSNTVVAKPPTATGTVDTSSKTPLSLREKPSTSSRRLARIPHKTRLTMTCKTLGDNISDGQRASNVWNRVTYQKKTGFVASVFVKGGDSDVLTICQTSAAPTGEPTPSRPPDVEQAIIKHARVQRGRTEGKNNCNPYGDCTPWSALFATWAWNRAGNSVPKLPFSGDLYAWGVKQNRAHTGVEGVGPGDMIFFGTGPDSPKTSTRVDLVIATLADGRLRVIGGDVKGKVVERSIKPDGIYAWVDA